MAPKLPPLRFVRSVFNSFTKDSGLEPSLVDLGGSLAVASKGRFMTGVSTDINVTYLNPGGKPGDIMTGTATCDKITFFNNKGELAARGSHTKYIAKTWGSEDFVAPDEYVAEEEK
ncbi:hypothetical protein COL5a_006486 [Colletotrichum fioriniae]|nr:hypothetical protein COL5a_006486 [Colletotrichum fioriniae]